MDYDSTLTLVSLGPLEQQESLAGLPAAKRQSKSQIKRKQ
jgi:hypothetical protein